MKKSLLVLLTIFFSVLNVQNSHAQSAWTQGVSVTTGDFYIYNIGAQRFLARGSAWDTHAIVDGAGAVITIAGSSNAYTLHFPDIASNKFLANEGYTDAASDESRYSTFTFEPVSGVSGYTNVYRLKANNGGNYYYWNGGSEQYRNEANCGDISGVTDSWAYWILVPKATRESTEAANASNPVDVTYLVSDPDLERRDNSFWGNEFVFNVGSDAEFTVGGFLEKWAGYWEPGASATGESPYPLNDYSASQTLLNLQEGKYVLTVDANAYCQDDPSVDITGVKFFVGNQEKNVITGTGKMSFTFVSDGSTGVEVGMKTESTTANWVYFDNLRLTYYGPVALPLPNDDTTELTVGQWYYYDISSLGTYNMSGNYENIGYTLDGNQIIASSPTTKQLFAAQTFNAGRIYFMTTTSDATLRISSAIEEGMSTTFTACALNVDGLPNTVAGYTLNEDGPGSDGTKLISKYLADKGYDIHAFSEDFNYNGSLMQYMTEYNFGTLRTTLTLSSFLSGGIPFDTDGLMLAWKNGIEASGESWTQWEAQTSTDGNQYVKKGYRYYAVDLGDGMIVDVYILHMDAGDTASGAVDSRNSQWTQLANAITANPYTNRPKLVMGDTNSRYNRESIYSLFFTPLSTKYTVTDTWMSVNGIDVSTIAVGASNTNGERVDKILILNPIGANNPYLTLNSCWFNTDYTYETADPENYSGNTTALGDHNPLVASITYTQPAISLPNIQERWAWQGEEIETGSQKWYLYNIWFGCSDPGRQGFLTSSGTLVQNPANALPPMAIYGSATSGTVSCDDGYRLQLSSSGASVATSSATTMDIDALGATDLEGWMQSYEPYVTYPITKAYRFSYKRNSLSTRRYFNADSLSALSAATSTSGKNAWALISYSQKQVYDRYVAAWNKGVEYLAALPMSSSQKAEMAQLLEAKTHWKEGTTEKIEALNAELESWFDEDMTTYVVNPSFELDSNGNQLTTTTNYDNYVVPGWTVPTDVAEAFISYKDVSGDGWTRNFNNVDGNYVYNVWGGSPANGFYCEQTISDLPEGFYKLKAVFTSDDNSHVVTLKLGSKSVSANVAVRSESTTIEVPLYYHDGEGDLTIGAYSIDWFEADNFQLYRYDYYYDESVTSAEYATTAIRYNTEIPSGLQVYYATQINSPASGEDVGGTVRNTIHLEKYTGTQLKAEEGVILYVENQPYTKQYRFYRTAGDVDNISGNILHGTSSGIEVADKSPGCEYYMLAKKTISVQKKNEDTGEVETVTEPTVGFYRLAAGTRIKPHKAYLMVNANNVALAKTAYIFDFGDTSGEATGVMNVEMPATNEVVGIYSLSGARQQSLQPGVNILRMSDGTVKKVLVK